MGFLRAPGVCGNTQSRGAWTSSVGKRVEDCSHSKWIVKMNFTLLPRKLAKNAGFLDYSCKKESSNLLR